DHVGCYVCDDVPGQFKWQDGPLTRAVREGEWVLFEDVDMAPPDVLSALRLLLDTGELSL
ncbi:midasin, partial [Kipferlia bialata]